MSDYLKGVKVRLCTRSIAMFNVCYRQATYYYRSGARKQKVYCCDNCKAKLEKFSKTKIVFYQMEV